MENIIDSKVGRIVAQNFRAAKVLSQFGIDFCCQGGTTLRAACDAKGLDEKVVMAEIQEALKLSQETDFAQMNLDDLVDWIVNVHHTYIRTTAPALLTYLNKIVLVHGPNHPELLEIETQFKLAIKALMHHMDKEEMILFPYIKAMCQAKAQLLELSAPHFGHIDNPISMMEEEHSTEGERFREISELSDHYTCPAGACQTYMVSFAMLKDFEEDLHKHIHLENNVLFPKAKKLFNALGIH